MAAGSDGLRWVRETCLVSLVDVPRSTYASWAAEGLLERPDSGAYTETHVVEALLLHAVRARLPLAAARNAARRLRSDGLVAEITDRFREPTASAHLDLVIESDIGAVSVCFDDADLLQAVRHPTRPRTFTVVPLADDIARAMTGFDNNAERGSPPTKRSRGRPRTRAASVTPLRREG